MKKIMFNDKYGLTKAVLNGTKTMTRRIVSDSLEIDASVYSCGSTHKKIMYILSHSPYKIGDEIAIAQNYKDCGFNPNDFYLGEHFNKVPGWANKMFTKPELMPHRIRVKNVKVERLQDISEEDCLREGIIKRDDLISSNMDDVIRYTFEGSFENHIWMSYSTPREAFEALINKVSGKETWFKNPLVFAYEIELI